ncbi:hypothetical protein B296_00056503 [Ensete ventricosum]|uniref:Uncharacterized protein n=1 Tax=Ensete ventricosum TaxID=4639 RepID=A0A426XV08_ENSVE|nr:hypothetical protein B296_00056503 [Ensete ventricosum]
MEIRPSWEEALAFSIGKMARELEVDKEDIEEKDVASCCVGAAISGGRGGATSQRCGGCGRLRQRRSGFSQVWGLWSVAIEEERLLVGVGAMVSRDRGGRR